MWANAMAKVAGELTTNLASAAPEQRRTDMMWASALGASASHLAMSAGYVSPAEKDAPPDVETIPKRP
jgi:hypothetical protein